MIIIQLPLPFTDDRRARLVRELAGYLHTQATMPYPAPLASALRCLIAATQAQIAALDEAELNERKAA